MGYSSKEDGSAVNFLADTQLLEDEFPKVFLQSVKDNPNSPKTLPERVCNKLKKSVEEHHNSFIRKIRTDVLEVDERKFSGMTGSRSIEILDECWLRNNFHQLFNTFNESLYKTENVGKWMEVPPGLRQHCDDDDVPMPTPSGPLLKFHFNNLPHCAFGNIGNLLCHIGDIMEGQEFFTNISTDIAKLMSPVEYSKLPVQSRCSRFRVSVNLLARGGYQVQKLEHDCDVLSLGHGSMGFDGMFLYLNKYQMILIMLSV